MAQDYESFDDYEDRAYGNHFGTDYDDELPDGYDDYDDYGTYDEYEVPYLADYPQPPRRRKLGTSQWLPIAGILGIVLLIGLAIILALPRLKGKGEPTPTVVAGIPSPTLVVPSSTLAPVSPSVQQNLPYSYDPNGNLIERAIADSEVIRYEYDSLDRLIHVIYPDGSAVSYEYHVRGRLVQMIDPLGTTTYEYDGLDRLIAATDPYGQRVGYGYDLLDRLASITYPDGSQVRYSYDARGRLGEVRDVAGTTSYTYNDADQVVIRTLPNGVTTRYEYDQVGHLAGITHQAPTGGVLLAVHYRLDPMGNRTEVVMTDSKGQKHITRYEYDEVYRLTAVTYPDGRQVCYEYDAVGNRMAMITPQGRVGYTYDGENHLLRAGDVEFQYDARGNLVERRKGGQMTRYTYDYENRLVRVKRNGQAVEFAYDGVGRRLSKTVDSQETRYVYDLSGRLPYVLAEVDKQGNLQRAYTWGHTALRQSDASYLLEDGLGSVRALVDDQGKLIELYDYDAFGALDLAIDPPGSSFGFAGEQMDWEIGLLYLRARYYDPYLGRFVSKDPLPGYLRNPQSQNGYAYVANNPTNLVDPFGLQPPYPYCRDRYDQMPPYTGPRWTTPSEWSRIVSPPEPYYSGPTVREQLLEYQVWVYQRQISWLAFTLGLAQVGSSAYSDYAPAIVMWSSYVARPDVSYTAFLMEQLPRYSIEEFMRREQALQMHIDRFNRRDHYSLNLHDGPFPPDDGGGGPGGVGLFGGGGGGGASVGGVLLDQAAEVLIDLNDITGATYDPATGQLILLGKEDKSLPPMDMADLVVAIRAAYEGIEQNGVLLLEPPGVSIDPLDPHHPEIRYDQMGVTYLGGVEKTAFGQVLFEADRYLKSASLGVDNVTGQPFTAKVPGYKSLLELQKIYPSNPECPEWHRMWFFIGQVRLKESEDSHSMIFDESVNPIIVEARFVKWVNGEKVDVTCSDPAVDAFVQHFNEHYDQFSQEEPSLHKLQQLARVAAVVQWLRESEIPLDLSWMERYEVPLVDTPEVTPARIVEVDISGGILSQYGGVDFGLEIGENLEIGPDDGTALRRAKAILSSRPEDVAISWDIVQDGENYKAVALNLAPSPVVGGYSTAQTDLALPVRGGWPLQSIRSYNSLDPSLGELGHGWSIAPFELRDFQIGDHVKLVDLSGKSTLFDLQSYIEDENIGAVFLPEGPGNGYYGISEVRKEGELVGFQVWTTDRSDLLFDTQGRLWRMTDNSGNKILYDRDAEGRLRAIVGPDEQQRITLEYDAQGRLSRAVSTNGEAVTYHYDAAGDLVEVQLPGDRLLSYTYGEDHRLTSLALNGQTLRQNSYDELGRLVSQMDGEGHLAAARYDRQTGEALFTDSAGYRFWRTYDQDGRLLSQTDPLGHTTTYGYDERGDLISVTDPKGNDTRLEYDAQGRVTALTDALERRWEIIYDYVDEHGNRLEYVVGPDGLTTVYTYSPWRHLLAVQEGVRIERTAEGISMSYDLARVTRFQYDQNGQLQGVQQFGYDASGKLVPLTPPVTLSYEAQGQFSAYRIGEETLGRRVYDEHGLLVELSDPMNRTIALDYDGAGRPTTLSTATGKVNYAYDELGRLAQVIDANGRKTGYEYDAAGNLIRVIQANGAVTEYIYDGRGNLIAVKKANGWMTVYRYDELGQLVEEVTVDANYDFLASALQSTAKDAEPGSFLQASLEKQIELLKALAAEEGPFSKARHIKLNGESPNPTVHFLPEQGELAFNGREMPIEMVERAASPETRAMMASLRESGDLERIVWEGESDRMLGLRPDGEVVVASVGPDGHPVQIPLGRFPNPQPDHLDRILLDYAAGQQNGRRVVGLFPTGDPGVPGGYVFYDNLGQIHEAPPEVLRMITEWPDRASGDPYFSQWLAENAEEVYQLRQFFLDAIAPNSIAFKVDKATTLREVAIQRYGLIPDQHGEKVIAVVEAQLRAANPNLLDPNNLRPGATLQLTPVAMEEGQGLLLPRFDDGPMYLDVPSELGDVAGHFFGGNGFPALTSNTTPFEADLKLATDWAISPEQMVFVISSHSQVSSQEAAKQLEIYEKLFAEYSDLPVRVEFVDGNPDGADLTKNFIASETDTVIGIQHTNARGQAEIRDGGRFGAAEIEKAQGSTSFLNCNSGAYGFADTAIEKGGHSALATTRLVTFEDNLAFIRGLLEYMRIHPGPFKMTEAYRWVRIYLWKQGIKGYQPIVAIPKGWA